MSLGWQTAADKEIVVDAFSNFGAGARQMIESAPDQINTWNMYDMKALPTWTIRHAALLGDAAHPFQPCKYIHLFYANHLVDGEKGWAKEVQWPLEMPFLLPFNFLLVRKRRIFRRDLSFTSPRLDRGSK